MVQNRREVEETQEPITRKFGDIGGGETNEDGPEREGSSRRVEGHQGL